MNQKVFRNDHDCSTGAIHGPSRYLRKVILPPHRAVSYSNFVGKHFYLRTEKFTQTEALVNGNKSEESLE